MTAVIIKLSNKFYTKQAIEKALKDYQELCDGKIVDNSFKIKLVPKKEKESLQNLKEEFCNYVLGVMKNI